MTNDERAALPRAVQGGVAGEPVAWQRTQGSGDQALRVVRQMVEAFDSGNLQMSSPEIGEPENDIPYHPWHHELLHYARLALSYVPPVSGNGIKSLAQAHWRDSK